MRWRGFGAVVGGLAVSVAGLFAQDVPTIFNMRLQEAQGYVVDAMQDGRIQWAGYGMPFQKAQGEARGAVVKTVLQWAKEYTESEPFGTRYANERKRREPRAPITRRPADEVLTRQKTDLDQRIAAEKRRLEAPPPRALTPEQVENVRKATEERLKGFETQRARFDDPQLFAEMRGKLETQAATEKQEYESAHAKWEEQYPADFGTLISKRLRTFLSETADVDFGAKLVACANNNSWRNHKCFANPTYERKPPEWKLSYRAGKPALDAARSFATNWLAEIEKK
jgi:hypothetical protein